MNWHPLICSPESVRAYLAGKKSQTRRVVIPQPVLAPMGNARWQWHRTKRSTIIASTPEELAKNMLPFCPHGVPGDGLWVRETLYVSECGRYFARTTGVGSTVSDFDVIDRETRDVWLYPRYKPTGWGDTDRRHTHPEFSRMVVSWGAVGERGAFELGFADLDQSVAIEPLKGNAILTNYSATFRKRLSSPPRWTARIFLKLVEVRVKPLQDITEADAAAEGTGYGFQMNSGWPDHGYIHRGICTLTQDTARRSYSTWWDSLNAKRGHGWDTNPWVWVLTTKETEQRP